MNVSSGGLSFDFTATNDTLKRVIQESRDEIAGLADASKQGGKVMDAAFKAAFGKLDQHADTASSAISEQRQEIMKLEQEIKNLRAQADAAFKGGDLTQSSAIMNVVRAKENEIAKRKEAINAGYEALGVLGQERERLEGLQASTAKAAEAHGSLKRQLRAVYDELAALNGKYEDGLASEQDIARIRTLQKEAGRLKNAIDDARTEARIFSDDNAGLTGAIAGFNGLMGAVSAAQGAMGLFGVENDKVQQAMLKVQSAMAITTGLQQVANALNKDSAFILVTVRKAKELLTVATTKLSVALGVSTVAAKALMATLTLGLSVAITALIALWDKYSSSTNKAKEATNSVKEAFDAYHKSTASKSAELVSKYQRLRTEYTKLRTEAEKTEWIKENAQECENLGLAVYGVVDADNVFIKNTPNVIKALELRAKAMALQDLQYKAYQEYYSKVMNADQTVAGGGYYTKVGSVISPGSTAAKELTAVMKAAGATTAGGDAYNDGSWYTMQGGDFKLSQKAIDAINAYRMKAARQTNQRIRAEATAELDKTVSYVNRELALTENEIKALDVLSEKHGTTNTRTGSRGGGGGGNTTGQEEDPFKKQLAERKALYEKYLAWITSSDATVREAAVTEFAPLLAEGETYLAYLEKERADIGAKATKTATDLKNLATLNDEIAQATKDATIKDFQTQLDADLRACTTLGQMLDIIEQRRKSIESDKTDVGDQERTYLQEAEDNTKKQIQEETAELLSTYVSYEAERLKFASTYARKRELLDRALAEAQTDDERAVIEAAIKGLEEQNAAYTGAKTKLYADLLEQYKTHEQQLADIQKKYGEQRREAEANGNIAMIQLINAKEQEEISKLAAARLMASESWSQLFTDTSRLATGTINRLIKEIEKQKLTLSAELSPADLKAMNDQLERARDELSRRNPFLALHESLADLRRAMSEKKLLNAKDDPILTDLLQIQETYNVIKRNLEDDELKATVAVDFADTLAGGVDFVDHLKRRIAALQGQKIQLGAEFKGQHELDVLIAMLNKVQGTSKSVGQGFKDTFADVGSSIAFVSGCFNSVVDGMKKMGISMDEETEAILGDIGGIMEGAQQLSEGIATGKPLGIIQGSISLFTSAFDLFNSRDRKAEKAIKKHEEALTKLKNAYNALEDAVNRALGETVYQNQSALIRNLRQQQAEINGMISAEYSKKHTDNSKIEEWREQYAELGRQIQDIIEEITQSITQTTAKDLAGDLADALVEAFEGGEDAAKAFGEVANDVIKKAVVNALKLQLLEQPLQNAIKQLQRDMGFDAEGNGNFDGLTESEQKRFKDAVEKAGANFQAAMDMYKDLFEQLDDSDPTTLSGAIKGASQESIDLLAGQTNAVRQNQVTALSVMREQLLHLSSIDSGVGVIANRLLNIYNLLTSPAGTSMRSQGITD